VPQKINPRITRMKRQYAAHGGPTATMTIQTK
jgi:hypothetical protein